MISEKGGGRIIDLLDAIFNLAGEWIVGNYLKLMTAVNPNLKSKKLLYILFGAIFLVFISGVCCLCTEDSVLRKIGTYIVAISLSIIAVNVLIGFVLMFLQHKKKQ